jgi:5,5'-dehydrodivanillate O-demethylase
LYKRRLYEGQSEDADDWRVGHPVFFPNTLAVGSSRDAWRTYAFQIRVPMDETHTLHYWYNAYAIKADVPIPPALLDRVSLYEVPFRDERGEFQLDMLDAQDVMAWVTQGSNARREREKLGWTDRGVILFRKMLEREIDRVAAGDDPMGVLRDPARNTVIDLPTEYAKQMLADGFKSRMSRTQARCNPLAGELLAVLGAAAGAVAKESGSAPVA